MEEIKKYETIYQNPEKYRRYGHSNHGSRAIGLLDKLEPKSLVDIGCGFNEFVESIKERYADIRAVGVDFACQGADIIANACSLPFDDKEFDILTSFDMMEHLLPEDVDKVLIEMARVSDRFCLSISYVKSIYKVAGETLHPTVRPEHWWKMRLIKAGAVGIKNSGKYIYGEWRRKLNIAELDSVLLVGNGPGLLEEEQGNIIDSFDQVIRFNNFKLDGFEKYVGHKTTLWSSHFKGAKVQEGFNKAICIHERSCPPESISECFFISSYFFDYIRRQIQDRARWSSGFTEDTNGLLPTSGLLVASYLLEIVGVKKIYLVGFDHFSKRNSKLHHYWVDKAFGKPKEHSGDVEASMFMELARAGRVEYL